MPIGSVEVGNYKIITATGNIVPRDGCMLGFLCSNTSSGTIQLYDSATTTTTTPITGVITPVAGTWTFLPVIFTSGLYAVATGTLNVTFITL